MSRLYMQESIMKGRSGPSSFSVLLLSAVVAILGVVSIPYQKVQYAPQPEQTSIAVSFYMPEASARVVEAEMTSKIEGILSSVQGSSGTWSVSGDGFGSVSVFFPKKTDMQAARLDVATKIRNLYPSLPKGSSYPEISLAANGRPGAHSLTYTVKSPLPTKEIAEMVESALVQPLSLMDGISAVGVYGAAPWHWKVVYDEDAVQRLGISPYEISAAVSGKDASYALGVGTDGSGSLYDIRLSTESAMELGCLPVRKVDGRVVRIRDIATLEYVENTPSSYRRVNGLNTVNLSVSIAQDVNLLTISKNIKDKVAELSESLPAELSLSLTYDSSEYISGELQKIYKRTLLCLVILLLFVFAVSRSWRYMIVIGIALIQTILLALCVYRLVGLGLHIYTLAGITVSFGFVIDSAVLMIDHYSRERDRRVFPSLLGAVLTTVASVTVVLLLPEEERVNLADFALVIAINLLVSLVTAYFFVPAFLDCFPVEDRRKKAKEGKARPEPSWYPFYISWGVRHRWLYIIITIVLLGIPTCLIKDKNIKWDAYRDNREVVDRIIGSTFGMFHRSLGRSDFHREPSRRVLSINAGMPEGCSVSQLNDVVSCMENYLSQFDEIEVFTTDISSAQSGRISVYFKPEYENGVFPDLLKSEVTAMAMNFGGATWRVYGVNDSYFNNQIFNDYKPYSFVLSGYNYETLCSYADSLINRLARIRRVSEPSLWGDSWNGRPLTEYSMSYDKEALVRAGISPYDYFSAVQSPLFRSMSGKNVEIVSSKADSYDLWHIMNSPVPVGETSMTLSNVGEIVKKSTGLRIEKSNQSYNLRVSFDFIGNFALANSMMEDMLAEMKESVLPIGYSIECARGGWNPESSSYYWLVLLALAIIFFVCSICFESLRMPIAVMSMVPLSFVGVFLTFGLPFGLTFDQGGFAAMVLLCGTVVNAGIYLVFQFMDESGDNPVNRYVNAFRKKAWPISLTILSSVLGLVPFLFDGPSEVFWFDFAIATVAGLAFSTAAMVFVFPVFVLRRSSRKL